MALIRAFLVLGQASSLFYTNRDYARSNAARNTAIPLLGSLAPWGTPSPATIRGGSCAPASWVLPSSLLRTPHPPTSHRPGVLVGSVFYPHGRAGQLALLSPQLVLALVAPGLPRESGRPPFPHLTTSSLLRLDLVGRQESSGLYLACSLI